jgi:NADH-quinone oxidoreductase subunit M
VIALRAGGSESLRELGGMAFRAPVLAGLFLVVSLATLAMPGSGNFIGEILILFGTFEDKLVYGLVASVGVALAAVYMIRLYQGTMHGRVGAVVESREIDRVNLAAIVPLVALVIALGLYPQFVVHRTEKDTKAAISRTATEISIR